jgi:hypothetical protein
MDNAMISKIEKAKRYAEQPERIEFMSFQVIFKGENSTHEIAYQTGKWSCTCSFFHSRGVCSHTMALERILGKMIAAKPAAESTSSQKAE